MSDYPDYINDVLYDYGDACAEMGREIERLKTEVKWVEKERDVLQINHKAMAHQLARTGMELTNLRLAVNELVADIRRHLEKVDELVRGTTA